MNLLIIYSGDRSQFLAVRFDAIDLIWKTPSGNVCVRTGGDNYVLPDAVNETDVDEILEQWKKHCDG